MLTIHFIFVAFRYALAFLTPGLPFIPAIAITVNIYLIFKLSILTLVRFTIWMTLGLIMYFYYGITHSSLENPTEEIELTVDTSFLNTQQKQQQKQNNEPTAVWDRHGYENKMAEDDWSTSQNNYTATATSWDINDVNKSWNNSNSNNFTSRPPPPQPPANKPKPTQTLRPSPLPSSQQQQPHQRQQPQQPAATQPNPKGGFGQIFVEETQFPTWDD